MPSSMKTLHYGLNQWLEGDAPRREDFNADNALSDAALHSLATRMTNVITLLGHYDTLEALQIAHPTGSAGQAYSVGVEPDLTIYLWDTDALSWVNIGKAVSPSILDSSTETLFVGILKGNGTGLEVAVGDVDFVIPIAGKQLSTEDYTTEEKDKLAEIEDGAEVNLVTSVAGRTGDVELDVSDIDGAAEEALRFVDVEVEVEDWSVDDTYESWAYRAIVPLTGVLSTMFVDVDVDPDTDPEDLCPTCDEYNGGIYLYSHSIPEASIILKKVRAF